MWNCNGLVKWIIYITIRLSLIILCAVCIRLLLKLSWVALDKSWWMSLLLFLLAMIVAYFSGMLILKLKIWEINGRYYYDSQGCLLSVILLSDLAIVFFYLLIQFLLAKYEGKRVTWTEFVSERIPKQD